MPSYKAAYRRCKMKKGKLPADWKAGLGLHYLPFSRNIGVSAVHYNYNDNKIFSKLKYLAFFFFVFFFLYGKHRKTVEIVF